MHPYSNAYTNRLELAWLTLCTVCGDTAHGAQDTERKTPNRIGRYRRVAWLLPQNPSTRTCGVKHNYDTIAMASQVDVSEKLCEGNVVGESMGRPVMTLILLMGASQCMHGSW